jgi:hypothetical protein
VEKVNFMKCPRCKCEMKPAVTRMNFYNEKIIVNPVKAMQCVNCGEETISESEYKRVKEKVNALRKVEKEQELKEILAVL